MQKFRAVIVGLLVMVTLLLGSVEASAAMPTPSGSPWGQQGPDWDMCAPGQQNCFSGLNKIEMSCVRNDDSTNSNIGLGINTGTNSHSTYQLILLRRWVYCGDSNSNRPSTVVVGNGYCLRWNEYASIHRTNGTMTIFGVLVNYATHRGADLAGNHLDLNHERGHQYSLAAWAC